MGSKPFPKGELEVINNSVKKGLDVKKLTENVVKEAIDEFKKNHSDLNSLISDEELISSSDESSVESTPKKRINRGKPNNNSKKLKYYFNIFVFLLKNLFNGIPLK
ncbi:hypothetical protein ACTFIW_009927 [Dictyostelium discoideum]